MTELAGRKSNREDKKAEGAALSASLEAIRAPELMRLMDASGAPTDLFNEWMAAFWRMKRQEVEGGRGRVVPWLRLFCSLTNGLEVLNTDQALALIRRKLPPLRVGECAFLFHDGSFRLVDSGEAHNAIIGYLIGHEVLLGAAIPYRVHGKGRVERLEGRKLDVRSGEVYDVIRETQAQTTRGQVTLRRGGPISLRV